MLLIYLKGYYVNSVSLSSYPMGQDHCFALKFQGDRKLYRRFMKKRNEMHTLLRAALDIWRCFPLRARLCLSFSEFRGGRPGMFPEGRIKSRFGIKACIEGDAQDRIVAVLGGTQKSLGFPHPVLIDEIKEAFLYLTIEHLG